jgi:hypothetical protein
VPGQPESDRQPVPWLIFLILIVLSAGAAVTGLVLAPPAADLAVHNAAGENLAATTLDITFITFTGNQPPAHIDVVVHPGTPPSATGAQTPTAAVSRLVISALQRIQLHQPWVAAGSGYRFTGSFSALVGLPHRYPATSPTGQTVLVTADGTSNAWVSGGYLAGYTIHLSLSVNGKVVQRQGEIVKFRKIDGYTPDVSHVSS